MKTNLGPNDLGDLLEQPLIGVLATRRSDDTTMLSPVWLTGTTASSASGPTPRRMARFATSGATHG